MKSKLSRLVTVLGVFLIVASATFAHHGTSAYDMTQLTTVKGTITDFQWANPHTIALFDVTDENGGVQKWTGEMDPPSTLHREGLHRDVMKPGDVITFTGNRCKTGYCIYIVSFVLPNGQEIFVRGKGRPQ